MTDVSDEQLQQQLLMACTIDSLSLAKRAIQAGADPEDRDDPAIVVAAESSSIRVLDYLLGTLGVDARIDGNRALKVAAKAGAIESLERLHQAGVRVDDCGRCLETLAEFAEPSAFRYLVEELGNQIHDPFLAMHNAAAGGQLETLRFIIEDLGILPTATCYHVLSAAVMRQHDSIIKYLVQTAEMQPAVLSAELFWPYVERAHVEMLQFLINNGVSERLVLKWPRTPSQASMTDDAETAERRQAIEAFAKASLACRELNLASSERLSLLQSQAATQFLASGLCQTADEARQLLMKPINHGQTSSRVF